MQKKFNKRKDIFLLIVVLVSLTSNVLLICLNQLSYDISGTYSAGNEPSMDNIYLVLKNDQFVIYNPKRKVEEGTFKTIEANGTNIYKLFSNIGTWKGYVIQNQNNIILLNFMETEVHLKKISTSAIYNYSLSE